MPILYRPLRQYMTPQNQAISATVDQKFNLFISGSQCVAYKFSIYDLLNNVIGAVSDTDKVSITTLYDGDELEITKDLSSGVSAGNEYKWQIVLYGNDLTVSGVNTTSNELTVTNHNFSDGDMIYIQSTTTIPSPLTAFTTYYVQKVTSSSIKLHTTYESARNGGTEVNISSAGAGTITISAITISEQIPFSVYAEPTLTLTSETIDKYYKEFVPVYAHSQALQPIKFIAELYDSEGGLLEQTDEIYSSNVRYRFEGFLPDRNYGIRFVAWNKLNQEADTGIVYFPVSYSMAILQTNPIAINNSEKSSVVLNLNQLYQIQGVVDPSGEYQYLEDFNEFNDDIALQLNANVNISFSGLNISSDNTFIFEWYPDSTLFDGEILKLENQYNTTDYIIIGYDNSLKKFYKQVNSEDKFYSAEKELVANQIYLIAVVANDFYVIDFYSFYYGYLEDYPRYRTLLYDSGTNYAEDYV